ncbi:MAG: hypothetical protein MUC48_26775 [Leptolyngbya sp. Prado105]|nr:hypothetical protein [Leptolyngbya sp. Prado105]
MRIEFPLRSYSIRPASHSIRPAEYTEFDRVISIRPASHSIRPAEYTEFDRANSIRPASDSIHLRNLLNSHNFSQSARLKRPFCHPKNNSFSRL